MARYERPQRMRELSGVSALALLLAACPSGQPSAVESPTAPPGSAASDHGQACVPSATSDCGAGARAAEASGDFATAASALKTECDAGTARACRELSRLTLLGLPDLRSPARALELEDKACELGDGVACALAAERRWTGDLRYPDPDRAIKGYLRAVPLLESACKGSDADACARLGVVFTNGWGIKADVARAEAANRSAATLWGTACDAGDARACVSLGRARARGRGVAADAAGSATALERACDRGAPEGCLEIALANKADAKGAYTRLAKIFQARCDASVAESCNDAAEVVATQLGEAARATKLRQRACELGHGLACLAVAAASKSEADRARAVEQLGAACERGDGPACHALGTASLASSLGKPDPKRARQLLERSCQLAHAASCLELGRSLRDGVGLGKDADAALEPFKSACSLGKKEGCENAAPRKK